VKALKLVTLPGGAGQEQQQLDSFCNKQVTATLSCGFSSKDAFEAIVKKHMKDAYFIAIGLVGKHEDALELSQEAFFRAFRNLKQLNSKDKFFPWFYQILRNLCFSHLRKMRVKQTAYLEELKGEFDASVVCDSFDPEVVAERNEVKDQIWKAIGQLDDKHREVVVLRHFRNLSYEEMARILFCSKGTVTSRLYYARKKLKEILDQKKGGQQ
jgi:RNA polymerase sigma-70 factor (ECF subfamily)